MKDRKQVLVGQIIGYLLQHGMAELSLRPLAAKIGTSARLLIFHFKTKEGLVDEVLDEVQARVRASFVEIMSADASGTSESPMKRFWRWAAHKRNLPYLRLLYEVHFTAAQNAAHARHLERSSLSWVEIISAQLPESIRSPSMATLCGAVFDGLLIELLATGDLRRTTRALDAFIAMLQREHGAANRARAPGRSAVARRRPA